MMNLKVILGLFILSSFVYPLSGQLRIGSSESMVNFREGPGLNFKIIHTIDHSNLLVILHRDQQRGFVEVFDVETSSRGFVSENLIHVTDTLNFQEQNFFESTGENSSGDVELSLINRTDHPLYVWINSNSYNLAPHEKKTLVLQDENITYFSSSPGLFPVFGKEVLKKGNTYRLNLSLLLKVTSEYSPSRERDTLIRNIIKVESLPADTVYYYSSRIDTIALQSVNTDTSKIVKDVNPQDLEESKYRVRLMGSVRVNSYFDFDGMTSTEGFLPYDIQVGEATVDNLSSVYIGARQSRLGIEGTASTKVGQIKTYMEVDFASSSSSFWRLRHAYAEWNFFKMGYTWSTFMDNASLPTTVDFEGPNSALVKRHGLIRFEKKFGEKSTFGISLEAPQTDYYNPADTLIIDKNNQGNFDLASRYKFLTNWGHIQVAGILRRIDYLYQDRMHVLYGWGLLLSSVVNIGKNHSLFLQYSAGEGIANYYVGFNNRQLDAIYSPYSDKMRLKPIQGGFVSYSFNFLPMMRFSATAGLSDLFNFDFEPDDAFSKSRYLAVNVFYQPIETIILGLELTNGTRVNKDKQHGNATRISLLARFDF